MANLYNSAKEGVDTNDVLSFPTETEVKVNMIAKSENSEEKELRGR